jgi:hypothetical protein
VNRGDFEWIDPGSETKPSFQLFALQFCVWLVVISIEAIQNVPVSLLGKTAFIDFIAIIQPLRQIANPPNNLHASCHWGTDVKPLLNSVDFRTCVVFIRLNFRDRGDHLAQHQAARPDESRWILGRGVSLLHIVPMRCEAHHVSCPVDIRDFTADVSRCTINLATYLYLVLRSGVLGAQPPLSNVCTAWCLIKHVEKID